MATSQLFLSPFVAKAVKDKKANGRPKAAGGPKQQATYGICYKWAVNVTCPHPVCKFIHGCKSCGIGASGTHVMSTCKAGIKIPGGKSPK